MNEKKNWLQVLKFTLFSASAGLIQIASFSLLELFIKITGCVICLPFCSPFCGTSP